MGRHAAKWRRLPSWTKPAGIALAAIFAGLTSFAGVPRGEEPSQDVKATTALRPAFDDRGRVLADLGASSWHQKGWRGQGVKVAILDSGFRGYRSALGKYLPARVTAKSFRQDGDLEARDSQHGVLCAEVIHTLAPDAEILLADWEPDVPESFVRALRWAKSEGAHVASCSVVMPSWSDGAGGGPTHAAIREIVGTGSRVGDMILTAAAGNLAQRHWTGPVTPGRDGLHQWSPGKHLNAILPRGDERVAVELYGTVASACRLQVFETDTGRVVQESDLRREIVNGRPWGQTAVRFEPDARRKYAVAVRLLDGSASKDDNLHVVVLGGFLEKSTQAGSIPFPGDGDYAITLGCVDEQRQRLAYSSCGPNSARPKPDFVAQVPFPSRLRAQPFTGTSAAAPQAAGLAAIVLSSDPSLTPDRVRELLRGAAVDLLQPGHDGETGYGLLRLP